MMDPLSFLVGCGTGASVVLVMEAYVCYRIGGRWLRNLASTLGSTERL